MDQKSKDLLKTVAWTIVSIAGTIFLISNANTLFEYMMLGTFALYSLYNLISIIRLVNMKEKTPEEIATEIEEKLVDVPKLEIPCKVSIERPSKVLGAMNYVAVYLHDFEVGRLKNGKTLNFTTEYATNEISFVGQRGGNVKKTFQADSGGSKKFIYNYLKGTLEEI
jgi:hypothetical protein